MPFTTAHYPLQKMNPKVTCLDDRADRTLLQWILRKPASKDPRLTKGKVYDVECFKSTRYNTLGGGTLVFYYYEIKDDRGIPQTFPREKFSFIYKNPEAYE